MNKPGIKLKELNWLEADLALTSQSIVVIPLGAQLKEHGPHLPLNNDWLLANYLTEQILQTMPVITLPTVSFSYYPAMTDYPGTVSLQEKTALNLILEIIESITKFGPQKFYCLNTGISTIKILKKAQDTLSKKNILLKYTDLSEILEPVKKELEEQEGGSHADEIETSIVLAIAPQVVNMDKAKPDYDGENSGPLRRIKELPGTYSPTGIFGDPTKATRDKGLILVEALINGIVKDIQDISRRS